VRDLAAVGCTIEEIALQVKCNPATIYRRFAGVIKEGRLKAYMSLRRKQFEMAMKGNTGMLVWLGKQWLGQSEKREVRGPDQGPIQQEVRGMDLSKLTDARLCQTPS
jgi:hypothetical protein